ncbi:MAG: cell wall hydrolase [Ruminococcaceae bacterium]|nr:cell wall hydrolase [Oscillospiraceae bacterium]
MKGYRWLWCFSLLSLAIALSFSYLSSFLLPLKKSTVAASSSTLPTVILDAGHGGEDGGAGGGDGTLEKDLNLSITRMLATYFRLAGYTVVETRTEDRLLYDEGTKKGHKKQSDLQNRLAIAAQYPNGILISIHMNSYPGVACRGLQVWYARHHAEAALLAAAVQDGVRTLLQPDNHRKIKAATSGIYLLNKSPVPAILIECGFLSTPEECAMLAEEEYRRRLAFAIFAALSKKMEESSCAGAEGMI